MPEAGVGGPVHSIEVERKYDVAADTVLPDFATLPGVALVGEAEPRDLDARYLDTADLTLAYSGVAVRRREGGPDAGWHVKASAEGGKHEWHWPLGEGLQLPAAVAAHLAPWSAGPFTPLARIRNHRIAYALCDVADGLVAEVVDDHVRARNERSGGESSWREWEVELGPAAPADVDAFFAAVQRLVQAAGGRPAASASKLARALAA